MAERVGRPSTPGINEVDRQTAGSGSIDSQDFSTGSANPGEGDNGRFARLARAAIFDTRVSSEALRVLAALAVYANREGQCFPSIETIARRLSCSERQVQRHIRSLRDLEYIIVFNQKRTRGGKGRNVYMLRYPRLSTADGASEGDRGDEGGDIPEKVQARSEGHSSPIGTDTTSGVVSSAGDVPGLFDEAATIGHRAVGDAHAHAPASTSDTTSGVVSKTTSDDVPDTTWDVASDTTSHVVLTSPIELSHLNKPSVEQTRARARPGAGAAPSLSRTGARRAPIEDEISPWVALHQAVVRAGVDEHAATMTLFEAADLSRSHYDAWCLEAQRGTLDVIAMLRTMKQLHAAKGAPPAGQAVPS